MKPRLAVLCAITIAATILACGKKSGSPTAVVPEPAQCAFSATSLTFGSVTVGSSADRQLTLTNTGGGSLSGTLTSSCTGFQVTGSGSYSLNSGQSKSFTIRFSPPSAGALACTLSTGGCQVICSGTGVAQTIPCTLSAASLDFGDVTLGQNVDLTFTLTNQGTSTLSGWVDSSCPDFNPQGDVLYNLAPGEIANVLVRFTPTQAGPQSCTISTGAPGCPTVSVSGRGVAPNPGCEVSTNGLLFPQVALGERADATFEVTNTGTANLIGTVTESCPDFSIPGQASYNLAPGASQTFIVRFEPSTVGNQFCQVNVGAGCPPLRCSGSGVVGCTYTPELFEFGYFRPGEIRCGSLKLTNNTATLQTGALSAEQVGWYTGQIRLDGVVVNGTGSIPYTLNAGQSRTFTLCWTAELLAGQPTRCDTTLGEWRIRSSSPACDQVVATIKAIITHGCECTVFPTQMDFGSVVVGDVSSAKTISISNKSRIEGLRGSVRVLTGDFELSRSDYACGCTGCSDDVTVRFRPLRLGAQTGRILIENLVGCLGPGATTMCDTVTVTGVGVTAANRD